MKAPRNRNGFTLIEMLVYMNLFALLAVLVVPLLKGGLDLTKATAEVTRSAQSAQKAFEWIRRDMRCASAVEFRTVELPSGPVPVMLRYDDGTSVAYTIKDQTITRIKVPEGEKLWEDWEPPIQWVGWPASGKFTKLKVEPVPDAERVYRIDLTARIRRAGAGSKEYKEPVFTTAVQVREEDAE